MISFVQVDNNLLFYKHLNSAYSDYIAARYLLNQAKYLSQAVTLSSTAIEKYIKSVLASLGLSARMRFHLLQIDNLKELLRARYTDFTRFFDPCFLEFSVWRMCIVIRRLKKGDPWLSISQFIDELDFIVYYVDGKVLSEAKDRNGQPLITTYKSAIQNKESDLYQNNHILRQISKRDRMEKRSNASTLHLDPLLLYGVQDIR